MDDIQLLTSFPDFSASAISEPKSVFSCSLRAILTNLKVRYNCLQYIYYILNIYKRYCLSARRAASMGGNVTTKATCLKGRRAGS